MDPFPLHSAPPDAPAETAWGVRAKAAGLSVEVSKAWSGTAQGQVHFLAYLVTLEGIWKETRSHLRTCGVGWYLVVVLYHRLVEGSVHNELTKSDLQLVSS